MTDKEIMEEVNAINSNESDLEIRKMRLQVLYLSQRRVLVPSEAVECLNAEAAFRLAIEQRRTANALNLLAQPERERQAERAAFDEGLGARMEAARRRSREP